MNFLFALLLGLISLFLILLVLVQRGRGGGLTGALGGMGGQSAFGTKAGDTFTRVTIIAATVWILLAILAVRMLGGKGGVLGDAEAGSASMRPPTTAAGAGGATSAANPLGGLPAAGGGVSTAGDSAAADAGAADGTSDPAKAESNPE